LIERRRANRFQVDWPIRVESPKGTEGGFTESGALLNISSSGALLSIKNALPTGTPLDVYIKLPLQGTPWMKYTASVVRIDLAPTGIVAAVRFDTARPDFDVALASM